MEKKLRLKDMGGGGNVYYCRWSSESLIGDLAFILCRISETNEHYLGQLSAWWKGR